MSLAIEKQEEEQREGEAQIQGIPVWGANISSPVVDQAYYIEEIHFRIGNRMYIENAD
jgi:hypothetical protein